MAKSKAERGRFSSRKKMDVVLRVLRGEDLNLVSREAGITAAKLSEWRDHFMASGQAGLRSRAPDGRDEELARLKALVGDLTMRLELSREARSSVYEVAPLWPPGGRCNEPRPVAFPATVLWRVRVCQECGVRRSTFYHQQHRSSARSRPAVRWTCRCGMIMTANT